MYVKGAMELKEGYSFTLEEKVGEDLCTSHMEGVPPILSTPGLVFLVEKAGDESLKRFMGEGEASVGIFISLEHMAPTPVGDKVRIEMVARKVDGKKIHFSFEAFDSRGKIASGEHTRVIVNIDKFRKKLPF